MSNETVAEILKKSQQLWVKWRDCVPDADSDQWDLIVAESEDIMNQFGEHLVCKNADGMCTPVLEPVAGPIVLWLLGELENRIKSTGK